MNDMLTGAIVTATLVIALFFLRFWRSTGDRLFLFFALAFFLDGLGRLFLLPVPQTGDEIPAYYLMRLVSYALILYAILDKNRPHRKDR